MSKGKILQIIIAVLLVGLLAAGAVVIGVNWDAITAGARGDALYTKDDVTNAYDKGFGDGALKKFEQQSTEIGRLQSIIDQLQADKAQSDAQHAAELAALTDELDTLRANLEADLERAFAQGVASVDLENKIKEAYDKGYADGEAGREPEVPPESKVWNGKAITNWHTKTGEFSSWSAAENAYFIYTAEQFAGLAELVNNGDTLGGERFVLKDDMILNAAGAESPNTWTSIGNGNLIMGSTWTPNSFAGELDGNGHTVTGVRSVYGLFGAAKGAYIRNLTVTDTDVPLVSNAMSTEIRNCAITITGNQYAHGGIVDNWYAYNGPAINDRKTVGIYGCIVYGSVSPATNYAGGLVGVLYRNYYVSVTHYPTFADNAVSPAITAPDYVGGLIGYIEQDYVHPDIPLDLPADMLQNNNFAGTIHCAGSHYSSEIGGYYQPKA